MEQIANKKKYAIAIAIIIVVVSIIVVAKYGFNKELRYRECEKIDIYLEQEFDKDKIKQIVKDEIGNKNIIQTVEIYEDMVTIRAEQISEEQKNNIVNKIKENYEFETKAEDVEIKKIPATKIRDMYKPFILPFTISGIIVLAYMVIRYNKIGKIKVAIQTCVVPVIGEIALLSVIAITRIPMGRFIPVLFMAVYIGAILYVIKNCETNNEELKEEK